ncbi:circularly permuted type 2 ATP-grasp protein, partial [Uliginosibacterium sp. sgz301328]|uniref:circularly permuted type 2 ATP-grasp protein n=1 Tax=Uliginosibacterium sp. sgz301328 TaxID=3243764 RepID=UPI00359D72F9
MAATQFYNEMTEPDGEVRSHYNKFQEWLGAISPQRLADKREAADALFHRVGITFAVYGEAEGTERLIPFDVIPRIIPADEWQLLASGLRQRVKALNAFIHDIYHDQAIIA